MKKLLKVLTLALVFSLVFVSCNSEANLKDEHVSVSFSSSTARALSISTDINLNDPDLEWHYSAQKKDGKFTYGQTTGKKIETMTNGTSNSIELSQGRWDFVLWALKNGVKAFEGSRSDVLIQKGSLNSIDIEVDTAIQGQKGAIQLEDVKIQGKNDGEVYTINRYQLESESATTISNETATISDLEPGSYKLKIAYVDTNDIEYSQTIIVPVNSGRTTTITGTISEETAQVTLVPQGESVKAIATVEIVQGQDITLTAPVTPLGQSDTKKTTVEIPKNVLTGNSAKLTVEATPATSAAKFSVTTNVDAAPIASLNLNLSVDSINQTSFNGEYVTITTYIAKGLVAEDVKVVYNGDGEQPKDVTYDSTTGKLTFKTNHFSQFIVESSAVVLNQSTNVGYKTLRDAIANVGQNETLILLADLSGNGVSVASGSNFTLDYNGHTFNIDGETVGSTGTETNGFQLLKDSTITFKNGVLTSNKAKLMIQNYSNLTLDNMILDGTKLQGSKYALSTNNGNSVIKDTKIFAASDGVAFDVWSFGSYESNSVTVTGRSEINGPIDIGRDDDNTATLKLHLESGTFNRPLTVNNGGNYVVVTKADAVNISIPDTHDWVNNKLVSKKPVVIGTP